MKAFFQIKVKDDYYISVVFGGDMATIASEVAKVCLENEEFAMAMNAQMKLVNDELNARQIRDEMIGMIKNPTR